MISLPAIADAKIHRSRAQVKAFLKSQGYSKTPHGFHVDHIVPLCAGQKDIMCKMDTMCLEAENKSVRERLARVEAESLASATANSTAARLENFVVEHYNPTVK